MIQNPNEPNSKPTMSSTEAAALISSNGATSDAGVANMMAEGKVIDPEAMVRAFYRRALGFDFSVLEDDKTGRWIIRDDELGITVTTPMSKTANFDEDAQHIANACIKLKAKHDKKLAENDTPEGELA